MEYGVPYMKYTSTSYEVHMYLKWCTQKYPKWQNINNSATKGNFGKNILDIVKAQLKRILAKISARSEGVRGPHIRYTCTSYQVHVYLIWGTHVLNMRYKCTSYEENQVCPYCKWAKNQNTICSLEAENEAVMILFIHFIDYIFIECLANCRLTFSVQR